MEVHIEQEPVIEELDEHQAEVISRSALVFREQERNK